MVPAYIRYSVLISTSVVALAGVASTALGNDRDLRATMIPASSCQTMAGGAPGTALIGRAWLAQIGDSFLACPLPLNNVDLGGTSGDNDITKFRVHYLLKGNGRMIVALAKSSISNTELNSTTICSSTLPGTNSVYAKTIVACPHDIAGDGSFYHFEVVLQRTGQFDDVRFVGIDFPQ